MIRSLKATDPEVIAALLSRFWWREGDMKERLRKVEKRARQRAKGEAYTSDPDLDRAVAKLAKRIRKVA